MHKSCDRDGVMQGQGAGMAQQATLIALYLQQAIFFISALKMHNSTSQIH